jgi:hypothetical protein
MAAEWREAIEQVPTYVARLVQRYYTTSLIQLRSQLNVATLSTSSAKNGKGLMN